MNFYPRNLKITEPLTGLYATDQINLAQMRDHLRSNDPSIRALGEAAHQLIQRNTPIASLIKKPRSFGKA